MKIWWNIERDETQLQLLQSVTQYTDFNLAFFLLLECHAVSRYTGKCVSFTSIRKVRPWNYADFQGNDECSAALCFCGSRALIFTQIEQKMWEVRIRNEFTPLSKVWLSLTRFSRNLGFVITLLWTSSVAVLSKSLPLIDILSHMNPLNLPHPN